MRAQMARRLEITLVRQATYLLTYLLTCDQSICPSEGIDYFHQLILVTSAGKDWVQGRSADSPGTARWCPSVPAAVYTSRRHPVATKTSVFHLGRSVRSCRQTAYCWTSCFLCRWRSCLERSSCRRHFSTFSVHFPKTFKTASFFHSPILALSSKLTFFLAWSL